MLSIAIPVLDEKESLKAAIPQVITIVSKITSDFELIISSDGPTCTSTILDLKSQYPQIRQCHSNNRRGKGGAITDALFIARGEFFCFFDVDLATDLIHLNEMVGYLKTNECDLAIGSRRLSSSNVTRSVLREFLSRAYISYVKRNLNLQLSDFQCGFKGFKTDVLKRLSEKTMNKGWAWDTEILAWAVHDKYKIVEFPVSWKESEKSNIRIRDILKMAMEVKHIKKRVRRH